MLRETQKCFLKGIQTFLLIFSFTFLVGCNELISKLEVTGKEEALLKNDEPVAIETEEVAVIPDVTEQQQLDKALDSYGAAQEFWKEDDINAAMVALDQAYAYINYVNIDDSPELIQQKDDLRFLISKRILEIYSSRHATVSGNHGAIPLVMNKDVEKELKRFQGPERRFFLESYKRSGEYRPYIVAKLKEVGLPEELSWLPLIESGFKVRAYSKARALGLWQFIPSTGYKFGLNRNTWMDERMDPWKATEAAIDYLTELHNLFGDWMTALAAYNCGEGRVQRTIKRQKVEYLDDFWDVYSHLPRETARYVPRFLATVAIIKNPEKYGFELPEVNQPTAYKTITVNRSVQFKAIGVKTGMDDKLLAHLNPELRLKSTPPTEYDLKLPISAEQETVLAQINSIPKWTPPQTRYVRHRVRRGDTLSHLAKRYRSSVRAIMRANRIGKSKQIYIGQKLKIPSRNSLRYSKKKSRKPVGPGMKYEVKAGDTLWLLAKKYGTTTKKLKKHNHLRSSRLSLGQIIVIPKG